MAVARALSAVDCSGASCRPRLASAMGTEQQQLAAMSMKTSAAAQVHIPLSLSTSSRKRPQLRATVSASAPGSVWGENPIHLDDDYIVLGLAQCYVKDESNKLQEIQVIEPIPAGALECMDNGGVTSYLHACGVTYSQAIKQDTSVLPPEFAGGRFCDEFEFRTQCALRTWKRQHAEEKLKSLVPLGVVRSDFNFSVEDKRVLNLETVVNDDDNIKQDLSIDVYGRKTEAEATGANKEIEKLYNA